MSNILNTLNDIHYKYVQLKEKYEKLKNQKSKSICEFNNNNKINIDNYNLSPSWTFNKDLKKIKKFLKFSLGMKITEIKSSEHEIPPNRYIRDILTKFI